MCVNWSLKAPECLKRVWIFINDHEETAKLQFPMEEFGVLRKQLDTKISIIGS